MTTDSPSKPATDSPSKPATDSRRRRTRQQPVTDSPSKPATDSPSKPATDSPSKPATDAPSKPVATDTSGMPVPNLKDACYVNTMIHFYRGELGRIMAWRQRLDVTTTWAITSTTSIITISFSLKGVPHIVFFFNLAYVWMLLWIEARRYRFYDAFRGRVRMVESHFLVPMILQNPNMLVGEWRRLVCEDLILPSYKISKLEAVGRRMKQLRIHLRNHHRGLDAENLRSCPGRRSIQSAHFTMRSPSNRCLPGLPASSSSERVLAVIALVVYVSRLSSEEVGEFRRSPHLALARMIWATSPD